jgi:small subunit ribosomal protein S1
MKKSRKIELAEHAGFCFGVRRAIEIAEKTLSQKKEKVYCLGEIIHNYSVVRGLEKKGLKVVKDLREVPPKASLIIRSHGVGPEIFEQAKKKKIKIIDATCPFVRKAQEIARDFHAKKFQVVIVGDKKHPEIIGLNAHAKNTAVVVSGEKEARKIKNYSKIGLLIQTTGKTESLEEVSSVLLQKTRNLCVSNTICSDSFSKKEEVRKMSKKIDILLVIGDRNSNNTKKLAEVGTSLGIKTYQIESADDIKKEWLSGKKRIGVTAGASTPDELINQVKDKINFK